MKFIQPTASADAAPTASLSSARQPAPRLASIPPASSLRQPAGSPPAHGVRRLARVRRVAGRCAALVAIGWGVHAAGTGLDAQEREWIFQAAPRAGSQATPIDGMDDVWIEHRSQASGRPVKLHALWAANPNPGAPLLLYLHGARRSVDASAFRIQHLLDLGFSVLALDYRGFGLSTDELPSEASALEDARAAWNWLGAHHPGRDRYLFGHSLGGAIAVDLAADLAADAPPKRAEGRAGASPVKGLIVEGTFPSIAAVFQSFRWGWLPITALITQPFDSAGRIERVQAPVLVVHGSRDALIPPQLGQALFDRVKTAKRFVLVEGGTHHSTTGAGLEQYRTALHDLFGLGG